MDEIIKVMEKFEEELECHPSQDDEDDKKWMIPGMFSALDINLGVFLYHLHQLGLLRQTLFDKPSLQDFWKSFMERPKTQEVCQATVGVRESRANVEAVGSTSNTAETLDSYGQSLESSSDDEEVSEIFKNEPENNPAESKPKERKKLRRKKQNEERSWYALW